MNVGKDGGIMKKTIANFDKLFDCHDAIRSSFALGTTAKSCGGSPIVMPTKSMRETFRKCFEKAAEGKYRDNYLMEQVSKWVISAYAKNPDQYKDFQRDAARPASVKRLLGCGSLLGSVSPTMVTKETGSIVQAGLTHCGSVWACPTCSAKIQTYRAGDVRKLIDWAREQGYTVSMVTLTARHDASDALLWLIDKFTAAYQRMNRGRRVRRIKDAAGWVGSVKAVEVTHGVHGWHWHNHILAITGGEMDENAWREAWISALISVGIVDAGDEKAIDAARQHALRVDVVRPDDVAAGKKLGRYVTKMAMTADSAAREVALSGSKLGRKASRTPFQMLKDMFTIDSDEDFRKDFRRYIEYVLATKGRQQMIWSHGLKVLAGIEDISDDDIFDKEEEKARILWGLTREHWEALRDGGWTHDYIKEVAPSQDIKVAQAYFDTMFPDEKLPPLIPADETERIWKQEREQRKAAGERYRRGETGGIPILTDEEKWAVYRSNHPLRSSDIDAMLSV